MEEFIKEIRKNLKERKYKRNEVAGVIRILEDSKKYNNDKVIDTTATEEEIEKKIEELFNPNDRDLSFKQYCYRHYENYDDTPKKKKGKK